MRGNIDERGRKLFIGGLHLKTTEESLKAFYTQWGDLIDVVVMRDPQSGKSRGFGFVTYNDPASVDLAQGNRPHEIDGIKVDAKRAMPKEDTSAEFHATVNRLFVGRLKKNLTAEDMKQYFSEYGTIADAVIINNPGGESRGFGFVTFDDPDSVDKIIVSRPHQIDGQAVEVKKALPRDDSSKTSGGAPTSGSRGSSRGGGYGNSTREDYGNSAPRGDYGNSAPTGGFNSAPRGSYGSATSRGGFNNATPRGGYAAPPRGGGGFNGAPARGGYGNQSFNNGQYEEPNSFLGANGGYRGDFAATNPYQQNYNAPSKPINNSPYGDQFNSGYGSEPPYGNDQQQYGVDPRGNFSNEPEYGFGQYNAPVAPSSRPYGYPPHGSMGEYNQKPAGGPMRGSATGFSRGGARYGTQPY